jgi:hypothetical protein
MVFGADFLLHPCAPLTRRALVGVVGGAGVAPGRRVFADPPVLGRILGAMFYFISNTFKNPTHQQRVLMFTLI